MSTDKNNFNCPQCNYGLARSSHFPKHLLSKKNISQTANHKQLTRIANFNVSNVTKCTSVNQDFGNIQSCV